IQMGEIPVSSEILEVEPMTINGYTDGTLRIFDLLASPQSCGGVFSRQPMKSHAVKSRFGRNGTSTTT
ncbi:MAG: hypothetical protein ACIAQF_05240, partial [Phycisphaerales bacterium JB065]